jgi:tRNA threonylcarbamoyladenosine biosynthesis protein TsaB
MILGIDTALGVCSVALLDNGEIVGRAHEEMQRGHAEALAPMVDMMMRESGAAFASLTRIAVTTGPGTFTGQRVGLAFARALGLALKIPVVGVTTLDAMAAQAIEEERAEIAVAVCDAKRGEVYLGGCAGTGSAVLKPSLLPIADAAGQIVSLARDGNRKLVLAGTGAELILSGIDAGASSPITISSVRQPDGVYVAKLGAPLDPATALPKPLYLRAPDAKLPKRPFT